MNDRQKYLFDLQGYLLVEDVLSPEDCDAAIEKIKARVKPMEKTPDGYDANGTWESAAGLYEAGEPFIKLIDHPKITEVLVEIIGPALRCETCYSFNDRAAIYHAQEPRRPSTEAFAQMTDNQKCYFNLAYQAFGPSENPRNDQPQFG